MIEGGERERVLWQAFPSWSQFSWLYFFSLLAAFRGVLFLRFGLSGWEVWLVGAGMLLALAAILRRWAFYMVTPTRVVIKNGYTGHEIESVKLEMIQTINLRQGPIARFWGIGTLVIRSSDKKREIQVRGVKDPEVIQARIRALYPAPDHGRKMFDLP